MRHVLYDNGGPGLKGRVDRLEVRASGNTKAMLALVTIIATVISGIFQVIVALIK